MLKKLLTTLALALGLFSISSTQAAAPKNTKQAKKMLSIAHLSPESQQIIGQWMPNIEKMAYLLNDDQDRAKQTIEWFIEAMLIDIQEMGEKEFRTLATDGGLSTYLNEWFQNSKMSTSFMVDYKDTESAIGWLEDSMEIEGIQLKLDFGVKNPEETLRTDQIFYRANQQLQTIGYHLVGIETGGDSYVEVLLPSKQLTEFQRLAEEIGMGIELNDEEIVYSED